MRTHQHVLNWLELQLAAGALALGDRLPPERTLAENLGVSRTSVREAVRILEVMGVVRVGVGSGPDAGAVAIADPTMALGMALRLHVATSHLPVADIVQTRVLLESWAASRASPDAQALGEAEELLQRMDEVSDAAEFLDLDVRFHLALSEAAGNAVVSTMLGSLREAVKDYGGRLTSNLPDWGSTVQRLRAEHRAILMAVRNDDGPAAADLVTAHIEGFYQEAGVAG